MIPLFFSICPSYLSTLYTEYISKQPLPSLAVAVSTAHATSLQTTVKISQQVSLHLVLLS